MDANVYQVKRMQRRMWPITHWTRQQSDKLASRHELAWLCRRWAEDGEGRPLLVRLRGKGQLVWCIPTKQHAAQRLSGTPRAWKYIRAFQVNQETGRWTQTREQQIGERCIVEVLARNEKVVRKARAWALAQRLTQGSV